MATAAGSMTLEEFLALPETKPYREFVCGEIKEKAMPGNKHAALVSEIIRLLGNYLHESRLGRVKTELRHISTTEQRAYLPDVCVRLASHGPVLVEQLVDEPPDLAIEVLSPGDRAGDLADKVAFYLRIGVPLVWVFDPVRETLAVHRPEARVERFSSEDTVTAGPVLPEFTLSLRELFDEVRES